MFDHPLEGIWTIVKDQVFSQLTVAYHAVDDREHGPLESVNQRASGPLIATSTQADEFLIGLLAVIQSVPPLLPSRLSAGVAAPSFPPYRGGNLDAGPVPRQQESRRS